MIYENVQSSTRPSSVTVEELPDGLRRTIITRGVSEAHDDTDGIDQLSYRYEEAVFFLPEGRTDSAKDIEKNLDAWWAYASEEHGKPTLDDRVTALEDMMELLFEEE